MAVLPQTLPCTTLQNSFYKCAQTMWSKFPLLWQLSCLAISPCHNLGHTSKWDSTCGQHFGNLFNRSQYTKAPGSMQGSPGIELQKQPPRCFLWQPYQKVLVTDFLTLVCLVKIFVITSKSQWQWFQQHVIIMTKQPHNTPELFPILLQLS